MAPVVVFDTNVFFSALGWQGRPYACLERVRGGAAAGVTSQALLDELAFSEEQIADALADLLGYLRVIQVSERLAVIAADPDDDRVLECAVAAQADSIVSGDRRHLLPLGRFREILIVSPADFLALVPEP